MRKLKIYCEKYARQHLILEEDYWNVVVIQNKSMDMFRKYMEDVFKIAGLLLLRTLKNYQK